ncbi:MAG TPA: hypothetical protein VF691_18795 [Cytophagaceae bacterium]|jgi:hypothetical protein
MNLDQGKGDISFAEGLFKDGTPTVWSKIAEHLATKATANKLKEYKQRYEDKK